MTTLWDIETGRKTFSFFDRSKRTKMSAMSFDFSGRRLIVGGQDGRLSMWNFNNGQCLKEFKGFGQNEVSCVACLEEGKVKFVAAGGWNGKVCIWGDGPREHEFVEHSTRGHSDDVISMIFFPPNCFATGGYDGKEKVVAGVSAHGNLYFWQIPESKPIFEVSLGHPAQPGPICLDSCNQVLFTSDIKGYVKAWTMKEVTFVKEDAGSKLSELFCFRAHHETIVSMIFIDEKKLLLTASIFYTCRLWTDTGVKIGQFGQSNAWDLNVPDTWASKSPTYVASIPSVRDLESISSTRSSSRISTSAGTSGSRSSNSQQTSRGSLGTAPLEVLVKPSIEQNYNAAVKQDATDTKERTEYPYSMISNMLEGGPSHWRLSSWFKPLQTAYNRKLPTKDLTPLGAVIPPNVSFIKKKGPRESVSVTALGFNRKKSRVQDALPRFSLPRFHFNQTSLTSITVRSETNSGRSVSSIGESCR